MRGPKLPSPLPLKSESEAEFWEQATKSGLPSWSKSATAMSEGCQLSGMARNEGAPKPPLQLTFPESHGILNITGTIGDFGIRSGGDANRRAADARVEPDVDLASVKVGSRGE